MVGEVPVAQVKQGLLDTVAIDIDFRGGQHSVCGIKHGCGNANVQTLLVGATTEQPKDKDADDTCREDGIKGKECPQSAFASPEDIEAGDANGSQTGYYHHPTAKAQLLTVGGMFLDTQVVVLYGNGGQAVEIAVQ